MSRKRIRLSPDQAVRLVNAAVGKKKISPQLLEEMRKRVYSSGKGRRLSVDSDHPGHYVGYGLSCKDGPLETYLYLTLSGDEQWDELLIEAARAGVAVDYPLFILNSPYD